MSIPARSLRVTIVSPDTDVLHDVAWMLTAVGYSVATSRDTDEGAAWRRFNETDMVIFDGRSVCAPTPATLGHISENSLYRVFLYAPAASTDLAAWFAAGANDALRVPISRGELLARLRVGARWLEFENRMRSQSTRSRSSGMFSARGLWRKLGQLTDRGSATSGYTLLSTTIDFFAGLCQEEGESAARRLRTALTTAIQQCVSGDAIAARGDDGIFHILLPDCKVTAARAIAEHIAEKFRAAQVDREPRARLSVTTAIVPWRAGVRPEQLLEQGRETVAIGAQSGGDCAIELDAYAHEQSSWQNELTAGSPFANVIAQDIMEPFPAVLERDSVDQALLAALRRSGAPVWPFVDRQGRLVGVASPESATDGIAANQPSASGGPVLSQPVTIAHDAAFPDIYDTFSTEGCLTMVVVADRRPIGYLTCSGFLSLIEPINSATFASHEPAAEDSRGLLVGSLVNECERESDSDQSAG
jgi:GGDEF domain-containing protein